MIKNLPRFAKLIVLVSILISTQGCAIYTRSNSKPPKKNKETVTGSFTPENLKSVDDGYSAFGVTADFLIASAKLNKQWYIPVGLNFDLINNRIGDLKGGIHYLPSGSTLGELDDANKFYMLENNGLLRMELSLIYSRPIWKKYETISAHKIDFGVADGKFYYGTMPIQCAIELGLRGGYEHSFHDHFFTGFDADFEEKYPTYEPSGVTDIAYVQQTSELLRLGLSFDRKIATRFKTQIDGHNFSAKKVEGQGFFLDLSYNLKTKSSTKEIVEVYVENGQLVNNFDRISAADFYPLRNLGGVFGYHYFRSGQKAINTTRFSLEVGVTPGYLQRWVDGFYVRGKIAVGLSWSK